MVHPRGGRRAQEWMQADLAALGALALAAVILLKPFLLQGQMLYFRDISQLYYPATVFIKDSLARGELPFWNPLIAGGYPQLASLEPALFFPGLLLLLALPYGTALTLFVLLSHLLAGWGMYALGRCWGWLRPVALLAAGSYAFSGYLVTSSNIYPAQAMAALLPFVILALERAWSRPERLPWLLATALLGLQLANTRPDLTLMEAILLTCMAIARSRQLHSRRPLTVLALAFAGGLLLNAASLLPAWEFILNSNRQAGIIAREAQRFSFVPRNTLALFVPWLFGDVEWGLDWGRYFIGEPEVNFGTFFLSLYLGWLPWLLLPAAWRSRRPDTIWLSALGLAALVLALGQYTPLYALFLRFFPGANLMRYPAKFFWLVTWALAVLAGIGLDDLLRRPHRYRWYWPVLATACLLPALAAISMWLLPGTWIGWLKAVDYQAWLTGPVPFRIDIFMQRLWPVIFPEVRWLYSLAILIAGLEAVVLALCLTRGRQFAWLLAAVVTADLLYQNAGWNFATSAAHYTAIPPLARELQRRQGSRWRFEKPLGQGEAVGTAGEERRHEAALAEGGKPHQLLIYEGQRARLSAETALQFGLAGVYGGSSVTPFYSATYLLDNMARLAPGITPGHAALAGMLNVRYLVVPYLPLPGAHRALPAELRRPEFPLVWEDPVNGAWLLENQLALPRAYFVTTTEFAPDLEAVTRRLASGQINLAERVLFEGVGRSVQAGGAAQVTLTKYSNQYARVDISAARPGYLVFSDNYYPGWHALINGAEAPILRANAVIRAVALQAGPQVVEFYYLPWSIVAGCLVSSGGWLALLAMIGRALRAPARTQVHG